MDILIYADSDKILFHLENQPATHPACNSNYFAIDSELPADRRKMLLSRLMLAYAKGETINIGYDGSGDCANGYIRVHRVG